VSVLNPLLLAAGVAAVALPILIHLLVRRRRRPMAWAAMRFVEEAIRRRRRRLWLERWLLLAARCLAVLLVGIALGRPLLGSAGLFGVDPVTLVLVVDNSIASGARRADGVIALERHRERALALLGSLSAARGDRAALVPMARPAGDGSGGLIEPTGDFEAVASALGELEPLDARADAAGALEAALANGGAGSAGEANGDDRWRGRVVVAVLADARRGVFDVSGGAGAGVGGGAAGDGGVGALGEPSVLASAPGGEALSNVGLASVRPVRPVVVVGRGESVARAVPVRVGVVRSGPSVDSDGVVGVRARFVDAGGAGAWAGGEVRLRAGEASGTVVLEAPLGGRPRGLAWIDAELVAGDAVAADDRAAAPVTVRRQLRVALIDRAGVGSEGFDADAPASWLRVALSPESAGEGDALADVSFEVVDPGLVDAGRLAGFDAALVLRPSGVAALGWEALGGWCRQGRLVAVWPDPRGRLAPWAEDALSAFGLGWAVGPEAVEHDPPAGLALGEGALAGSLLRLVAGELPDLLRPVGVVRSMPLSLGGAGGGEGGSVLLSLDGSSAGALVGRPGAGAQSGRGGAAGTLGEGLVVVFAFPLAASWTDLPARPAVVPLVQELVRAGVGLARGSRVELAGERAAAPRGSVVLAPKAGGQGAVVDASGRTRDALRRAGVWVGRDGSGREVGLVAVRPDTAGADVGVVPARSLERWLGEATGAPVSWLGELSESGAAGDGGGGDAGSAATAVAQGGAGRAISWWLLLAGAVVLVVETALARVFSHASVDGPAAAGGSVMAGAGS